MQEIEIGAVLEGRITGITNFGAFVALPGGKSGLVHISEVANTFVTDIHAFLTDGQTVKVKVLGISPEGRISLSVKKAEERPVPAREPAPRPGPRPSAQPGHIPAAATSYTPTPSGDQSFEDKLKQYMQDASSRISGNKLFEQQRRTRSKRR